MRSSIASALINHVRHFAGTDRADDATDRELLRRYTAERDERAFAALVHRHGPLVWNACRRVLNHAQDAEDAFQATFLVLARKASAVRWHESVAPWLFAVASRLARKVRSQALSRPSPAPRDQAATDPLEVMTARELLTALDEELARLPAAIGAPLVLCWYQDKTQEEAARLLGISLSTVRRRLERGRGMLHARLLRRGLVLSSALAATVTASAGAAQVPASLLHATKLVDGTTALEAAASARVAALARGALCSIALAKVRAALVLGFVALAGVGIWAYRSCERHEPPDLTPRELIQPEREFPVRAPLPPKDRLKDAEALRGVWKMKEADANGKHLPAEVDPDQFWTFGGGKVVIRHGADNTRDEWTFHLDEAVNPRAVDVRVTAGLRQGQFAAGIYELNGDRLRVCLSWSQPSRRPKEFNSSGDTDLADDRGRRLFVLERMTLRQCLFHMDRLRAVAPVNYAELERQGEELLALYTRPAERAKIWFQLAHVYGQTGIDRHPDLVTRYARLALQDERDPIQRGWLHTYLGCAAEVDPDAGLRNFEEKRRRAAAAYLAGYKEILPLKLPEKAPELPQVDKLGHEGMNAAELTTLRDRHEAQVKARREAEFTREMVSRRDILVRQVVELYRRAPADHEGLRQLATSILSDQAAVDDLLARVRQK
jgi:RNA polymerase sigma factor (sigma-70 family)